MSAVPAATAVIFPSLSTVAALGFEDVYLTVTAPETSMPFFVITASIPVLVPAVSAVFRAVKLAES